MHVFQKLNLILILLLPISPFCGNAAPDILLSIIAFIFVVKSIMRNNFRSFDQLWFKIFFAFWVFLLATSIFAVDNISAIKTALSYIRFPLFAVAIFDTMRSSKSLKKWLLFSMCISVLLISCNTIFQFIFSFDIFGNAVDYAGYPRLMTPSGKLTPGIMLSFFLLPVIAGSISFKNNHLYTNAAILGIIAVLLSGERTAFITTIIGSIVILLSTQNGRKLFAPFIIAIAVILLSAYIIKEDVIKRQIVSAYQLIIGSGEKSHKLIARSAFEIWQNHSLIGIGAKQYKFYCSEHMSKITDKMLVDHYCNKTTHPHNIFLEILIDTGLIGFILFLSFIASILLIIIRGFKKIAAQPLMLGAATHILIKLIPFAPISSFYHAWSIMPFWMMIGLVASTAYKTSRQ